ncbi:MAG TPA: hypothetical protein DCW74_17835 [Alteromonas australica]|uniref:BRCT domain-containing protein n=1 Tax=Alteromonas australica TaxID=589873 RepID=A0A350P8G3_9ALTE|nr:hypothetical protein [Alteromonas australica]
MDLKFEDQKYCFTGTLANLKRSQAQREVRAREGLTYNTVNERLDYLVVGSIPSPHWKHGDYGSKIQKARELFKEHGKPRLVAESEFMHSLASVLPTDSGDIDEKILVVNYKFIINQRDSESIKAIEEHIQKTEKEAGFHVYADTYPAAMFSENAGPDDLKVECRFVKKMPLDATAEAPLAAIEKGFEAIPAVDGESHWFERSEGTATFVRLLEEIPGKNYLRAL